MTDISVHYHNGTNWIDLTAYTTQFQVVDEGITTVPHATINLETERSNLASFIANPRRLIRVQVSPSGTYPIFFGYVDNPFTKTIAGTITERVKMSLDCFSYAQRLAKDTITYNYYEAQSAISPLEDANAYSYRDMIEAFLAVPDSARDGTGLSGTGFAIDADVDADGIDAIIDGSCNWSKQSLFEAISTVCDHIGYDGYYPAYDTATFTPTITLAPFNKTNAATIDDPMIGEPEYEGGSINDCANVIFLWGGVDAGLPSDGDRWTEYAVSKYNPVVWSGIRTGDVGSGTPITTVSDEDNSVFTDAACQYGVKCIKISTTDSSKKILTLTLNLANMPNASEQVIDAQNRVSNINFALKTFGLTDIVLGELMVYKYAFNVILVDNANNEMIYVLGKGQDDFELLSEIKISEPSNIESNFFGLNTWMDEKKWYYNNCSTFDLSNIVSAKFQIIIQPGSTAETDDVFGFYIDGLQFVGGLTIEPFLAHSELLCPPLKDSTSISTYGRQVLHVQDSAITSFEAAQAEKTRLLANLKDPNPILTFTKSEPEATQLYPSFVINDAYRLTGITYDWDSKSKNCKTTYRCVGKTAPRPPIWTMINELRYMVK